MKTMKTFFKNNFFIVAISALFWGTSCHYQGKDEVTNCDTCPCFSEIGTKGDPLDSNMAIKWIKQYGIWTGGITKKINAVDPGKADQATEYDSTAIHGIIGWTIPLGDIKKLLDNYKNKCAGQQSDSLEFRIYLGLDSIPKESGEIADQIENGMRKTHLILTLVDNNRDRIDLGCRDLIRPCPQMCDLNGTFAKAYKDGYNSAE